MAATQLALQLALDTLFSMTGLNISLIQTKLKPDQKQTGRSQA